MGGLLSCRSTLVSCRGNIILELEGSNAAKQLLATLNNHIDTKSFSGDRDLYLKVAYPGEEVQPISSFIG